MRSRESDDLHMTLLRCVQLVVGKDKLPSMDLRKKVVRGQPSGGSKLDPGEGKGPDWREFMGCCDLNRDMCLHQGRRAHTCRVSLARNVRTN